MTVYLIHLEQPIGNDRKLANHYIGFTDDLSHRIEEHLRSTWSPYAQPITTNDGRRKTGEKRGCGATLLAVANFLGIPWHVVRTWEGGRDRERRMKEHGHSAHYCPVCNPAAWQNREKEGSQSPWEL